ncbi:MAG: four helix bundle protein [Patescibacteria group bacterium]
MIRSYRELKVWEAAEEVFGMVCEDVKKFPNNRVVWIIADQVVRSSGSIGANIAEGFSRKTKNDIIRFFIIARGSASETEVWLIRAEKQKFISFERLKNCLEKLLNIQKMINSFNSKLRQSERTY